MTVIYNYIKSKFWLNGSKLHDTI
ncbi:uncharacterized protein METZ01_LOCUS200740 [marine metagenome]|uniref:Uncharacterized protein n=1 Tax=marine metagenome TaxID=408172 RepID=A0A382EAQ9_9ZZZZ